LEDGFLHSVKDGKAEVVLAVAGRKARLQ